MTALQQENAGVLADNLFARTERWGWHYVEPEPARESPTLASEPEWVAPHPPNFKVRQKFQAQLRANGGLRVGVLAGLLVGGILLINTSGGSPLLLLAVVLGAIWFASPTLAALRMGLARRKFERYRQNQWTQYSAAREEWSKRVQEWEEHERTRRDVADLWFPLELRSFLQRVDVFGGIPDGWAALLCTAGPTILQSGTSMLVVDLTEEDVTGPLCLVAQHRGFATCRQTLPANLEAARLLEGLHADAIAELIAESVDTMRRGGEDVEMRTLDIELILAVVTRLDGEATFSRISAGLLALQQGYDPDRDTRLTAREFQRLTEVVDTVASTERNQNELQFLRAILDMVATPEPVGEMARGETIPDGRWPRSGVSVLRTEDDNRRRRDFVDRLMAQVLVQSVRRHRSLDRDSDVMLVLAGADHLGAQTLELLARRCRQSGVRLVLLMEHLRGDLRDMLGGSDSVTFFMRLGNAQEAAAAAEHIGRGHRFLLTQLARQSGSTETIGTSDSTAVTTSDTTGGNESRGTSRTGWFHLPTISRQAGTNWSITTGESKQWSTNESRALSTTDGVTVSRVYEFSVEPTRIQSLDLTSFVFVETADGERRVVAGTCDPWVALMPRVAGMPLGVQPARPQPARAL